LKLGAQFFISSKLVALRNRNRPSVVFCLRKVIKQTIAIMK